MELLGGSVLLTLEAKIVAEHYRLGKNMLRGL